MKNRARLPAQNESSGNHINKYRSVDPDTRELTMHGQAGEAVPAGKRFSINGQDYELIDAVVIPRGNKITTLFRLVPKQPA